MRRFFVPDKEKCVAFLRAQKNVLEQNHTKGASPTAVLRKPSRRKAAKHKQSCYAKYHPYTIIFFNIIILYIIVLQHLSQQFYHQVFPLILKIQLYLLVLITKLYFLKIFLQILLLLHYFY